MNKFGVRPEKERALYEKMERLGLREADLVERFVRSGGHGGQNVNKTATCVYLRHVPTGIEVKCQRERSRALNRYLARRILVEKLEAMLLGQQSSRQSRIEKLRRQKRKRAKRAAQKSGSSREPAACAPALSLGPTQGAEETTVVATPPSEQKAANTASSLPPADPERSL